MPPTGSGIHGVYACTGLASHLLILFYGRGRNGKGVLLRLMQKILGRELFAVSLRPEDVEYHRGSEDRNNPLMGRLRGKRLAYIGETASGHMDWTLLKTLRGVTPSREPCCIRTPKASSRRTR